MSTKITVVNTMPGSTISIFGEPAFGHPKQLIGRTVMDNETTFHINDSYITVLVTHPDLKDFEADYKVKQFDHVVVNVIRTAKDDDETTA